MGVLTEQPGGRGSIHRVPRALDREGRDGRAMPIKMHGGGRDVRLAFSKFVDELVQNPASGECILAALRRSQCN